jgi:hypothetical protein
MKSKPKPGNERNGARATNPKKRRVPVSSRNGAGSNSAGPTISIEKDFYAWLLEQAKAIRDRRLDGLDWENIAEELEGMAASQKRAVISHLRVMLTHLLKWAYQTKERELHLSSWRVSIVNSRLEIEDSLEESPSLGTERNMLAFMQKAYHRARDLAAAEMGITDREMNRMFPAECPWTFEQFMAEGFLPEPQSAIATR